MDLWVVISYDFYCVFPLVCFKQFLVSFRLFSKIGNVVEFNLLRFLLENVKNRLKKKLSRGTDEVLGVYPNVWIVPF